MRDEAEPLWRPSPQQVSASSMRRFAAEAEQRWSVELPDSAALHHWSIEQPARFWKGVWDFCEVRASRPPETVVENARSMPGATWFRGARLNFAENLLPRDDDSIALVFRGENGARREVSWAALRRDVAAVARGLEAAGVVAGDRVAALLPNTVEPIVAMLATASLGAIWSSASPDFGVDGVLDRFGQVEPKVLFVVDGYFYGGRHFAVAERLPRLLEGLPTVERAVVVPFSGEAPDPPPDGRVQPWESLAEAGDGELHFEQLPFDHPLFILFSSGTTGKPKCIVHGAGGTLLQHLKEHRLHVDLRPDERLFYFTTCGWMMWNWLVSGLASGATLVLWDGSPFHPGPEALFDLASEERVTVFGTSAKYLDACANEGLEPHRTHDLSRARALLSTGSPLLPEAFDYVYRAISPDLHLASISGGTDIVSCFVLGDPTRPVHRGEIQGPGLGMAVEIFDLEGRRIRGEAGELVCTRPFPSMPLGFWGDADGSRYRAAYFERFPGVWHHGDWAEETESGGYVISGRSDAVLNPGGVRIGTAEIYRQVERLEEVVESICVGQPWEGDVRIVLFVVLHDGLELDDELRDRIRAEVRRGASPRHVPAKILQVADIPRTRSGKITELAVRDVVIGRDVANVEALANPEALELFRDREELCS